MMEDMHVIESYLSHSSFGSLDCVMIWAGLLAAFHGLLWARKFLAPAPDTLDSERTLVRKRVAVKRLRDFLLSTSPKVIDYLSIIND